MTEEGKKGAGVVYLAGSDRNEKSWCTRVRHDNTGTGKSSDWPHTSSQVGSDTG